MMNSPAPQSTPKPYRWASASERAHTLGMVETLLEDGLANDDPGAARRELRACGFSSAEATAIIREAKATRWEAARG